MSYIDYNRKYCAYGELGFPRCTARAYFYNQCEEYKHIEISEKLLHIGYLLWHGYDMRAAIHSAYKEHEHTSEDHVKETVIILLEKLLKRSCDDLRGKYDNKQLNLDQLIDVFFTNLLAYYHKPISCNEPHYFCSMSELREDELKVCNPWIEVCEKYIKSEFLYSDRPDFVCSADRELIEQFNKTAKEEYQYKLKLPVYPWYGNPLKANVILLSLNPGYVERESKMAKVIQTLPERYTEGYTEHLRRMLKFECGGFFPNDDGLKNMTYRDLANMHQSWYWWDRLNKAFINKDTGLTFEEVNSRFAVIQYVGYSSLKYKPFKNRQFLPSQNYTRQLIQYILQNNKNVVFIVARNREAWYKFLGKEIWDNEKFIESPDYLGQRFTKNILGEDKFNKIIEAFKNNI